MVFIRLSKPELVFHNRDWKAKSLEGYLAFTSMSFCVNSKIAQETWNRI